MPKVVPVKGGCACGAVRYESNSEPAFHIPDRYEQLVRYVGWYSSRSRGARKAKGATAVATTASAVIEVLGEYASRAKARGRGRGPSLPPGRG